MRYYVLADIHVTGGVKQLKNIALPLFVNFLEELNRRHPKEGRATVVFNGDFFDFYSVSGLKKKNTKETIREKALEIKRENKRLVSKLNKWCQRGNRIIFIIGNHDYFFRSRDFTKTIIEAFFAKANLGRVRVARSLVINKNIFIEHGHCFESLYKIKRPRLLMDFIRKNLRENFIAIVKKYPYIYRNRNYERNMFYLLLFIDPILYFKTGLKGAFAYSTLCLMSLGRYFIRLGSKDGSSESLADLDLRLFFPRLERNFSKGDFKVAPYFGSSNSLRFKAVRGILKEMQVRHEGKLRGCEERALRGIQKFLKDNPRIKHYVVGHHHLCFLAKTKDGKKTIWGLGTWGNWIPLLEVIDPKNSSQVNYWLHTLKNNEDNLFTKFLGKQLSYLEIKKGKPEMKYWLPR